MLLEASGISSQQLYSFARSVGAHYGGEVVASLVTAATIGLVTVVWNWFLGRRRLGWNIVYDERINQDDPSARNSAAAGGDSTATSNQQRMWEVVYLPQGTGPSLGASSKAGSAPDPNAPYRVTNGSLVVMQLRNIGRKVIREEDFGEQRDFTLKFPFRKVVHYKIRDNERYHDLVQEKTAPVPPGTEFKFNLPALQINRGSGFKILTLLEGGAPGATRPRDEQPEVLGDIAGGKIVPFDGKSHRWRWAVPLVVIVLVVGLVVGIRLGIGSQTPAPECAGGQLTISGSTAFAPIVNQVAALYEQDCQRFDPQIMVQAVDSGNGLTALKGGTANIAMYDGSADPGPGYAVQPVGDIMYAVVGNRSLVSQYSNVFAEGKGGGMTYRKIAQAFNASNRGGYAPVGRSNGSGTRKAFAKLLNEFAKQKDTAEQTADQENLSCAPDATTAALTGQVCLAGSTMDLLADVNNSTNKAIGYAEADAVPFFPNVGVIPINGITPTRQHALDGTYKFLATENLYTKGKPPKGSLTADFIDFLMSPQVIAEFPVATTFIACADMGGSHLSCPSD